MEHAQREGAKSIALAESVLCNFIARPGDSSKPSSYSVTGHLHPSSFWKRGSADPKRTLSRWTAILSRQPAIVSSSSPSGCPIEFESNKTDVGSEPVTRRRRTQICTRGIEFPLRLLAERLKCPAAGAGASIQ